MIIAAVSIATWAACIAIVICILADNIPVRNDRWLIVMFPNSPRKRKIVGTLLIVFAPISLVLYIVVMVIAWVCLVLLGKFFRWIGRITGM